MASGPLKKHQVSYNTLLYSSITPTQQTKTTEQSRKFSDYHILFFIVMRGNYTRTVQVLPSPAFRAGTMRPNLNEVDSLNTQRWYDVQFASDTSVTVQSSSNVSDAYIYIYGMLID